MKQLERGYPYKYTVTLDERVAEWDEDDTVAKMEGPAPQDARVNQAREFGHGMDLRDTRPKDREQLEKEPQLTQDQYVEAGWIFRNEMLIWLQNH